MVQVHQTEIEGSVVARYECESCHVARDAAVETYGLGKRVLGDREEEAAKRDAVERAEQTLVFVPCPSCGQRPSGRAEVVAKTVTRYATITLVGTVASGIYLQLKGMDDDELVWMTAAIGGSLAVFCAAALLAWSRHPWVRAVQRTHFLDDEGVVLSKGTQEQRRQEQVEATTLRRRVLVALGVALAAGATVAVVQGLDEGGEGVRAIAPPPSTVSSATTDAPRRPPAAALSHPLRHQLEVEGRTVDVVEGRIEVASDHRSEHVRISKLWSHTAEDVHFVYDPTLTVIDRDPEIVLYGDEGAATIRVFDDPQQDVVAMEAEGDSAEHVTATIGNAEREGRRTKGRRGERMDRFLFELDRAATVEVRVRRTRPGTPTIDRALASLTTGSRDRRPRYLVVVRKRLELFEGDTVVLESGLEATLRTRERVWRLVGGLRVEHPADVAVMARPHPSAGDEIVVERGGVELVIGKRPEVPSPQDALAWLSSASPDDAAAIETDVDGHRWKGLRLSADDEVLEAYGLLGHEGGLAVLVRHPTTGAEQARTLLASVVAPMVR
jgi:hypothetical protein